MQDKRKRIFKEWYDIVAPEFEKEYWQDLRKFLVRERRSYRICPDLNNVFNAYTFTNPHTVQVVIVGQDPYVQVQGKQCSANGLAFGSTFLKEHSTIKNIYSEICRDLQIIPIFGLNYDNTLHSLASNRVLLLNSYLTSRANQSLSHTPENTDYGTLRIRWDYFTGKTIRWLSENRKNMVFILMGSEAQELGMNWLRNRPNHLIITTTHPTSKAFKYGKNSLWESNFTSMTNEYLKEHNKKAIIWT